MICKEKDVATIAALGSAWPSRLLYMQPRNIVELGTGQGASGAHIMYALTANALFSTINYNDGHTFGEQLDPWSSDTRLRRISADTIDPDTLNKVPDEIDLLFIDTTHEAWHAATELRLWQDKLQDGAIVIVDDLNHHDMNKFWDSIPYDKAYCAGSCQGVFRYNKSVRYEGKFDRPDKTTYHGSKL